MPNTQDFKVHTVLVRPTYPKNIGQAARATANCGFGRLHIVDPQCELGSEMKKGAAGSQKTLDEAKVYSSWEDFNVQNPQTYRIALSRRLGRHRKLFSLEEGTKLFVNSPKNTTELFLIFGPEADGLSKEDLEHTHMCCNLSLFGDFKSLNLAHAVLLSQHTVHRIFLDNLSTTKAKTEKTQDSRVQQVQQEDQVSDQPGDKMLNRVEDIHLNKKQTNTLFPDQLFSKWLIEIGMQKDSNRTNAFDTLRRLILRAFPSQSETLMLEKALRKALETKNHISHKNHKK